jgi:hypothetical protein
MSPARLKILPASLTQPIVNYGAARYRRDG